MSRGLILVVAALLIAAAASGCSSSHDAADACATALRGIAPVTNRGTQRATGPTVNLVGANAGFTPTCVTDVPRGVVTLTLHNTGLVVHDIAVPAQRLDADATRGKTATIRVRVGDEPVVFVCRYHRHLGMLGVLIPAG